MHHYSWSAFHSPLSCLHIAEGRRLDIYRSGKAKHGFQGRNTLCCAATSRRDSTDLQRVLVLGGTGRVGTETIKALSQFVNTPIAISVAGRNAARGVRICQYLSSWRERDLKGTYPIDYNFAKIDIRDNESLANLMSGHDLVIHAAGPFQRRNDPTQVLRVAMDANVPYMDICDDLDHSLQCKKLDKVARERGYTGLISTGIYPGISNLMAAEAVAQLDSEKVDSLKLYYHTAGSGGIGTTVLASTFLILSENAVVFDRIGQRSYLPAAGAPEDVDFGGNIGKRTTYLLNLPEVVSLREILFEKEACTEVFAKFCTGPPIWNWLLQAMAKWGPKKWLANPEAMLAFAQFSLPIVKAVDLLSGARTGIRTVATGGESSVTISYEHENLARCVGEANASFALELLKAGKAGNGLLSGGILFPEELSHVIRTDLIKNATRTVDSYRSERHHVREAAVVET